MTFDFSQWDVDDGSLFPSEADADAAADCAEPIEVEDVDPDEDFHEDCEDSLGDGKKFIDIKAKDWKNLILPPCQS